MSKEGSEMASSSESDSQSLNELTWIQWFCAMRGNEFFCEVDEEFIQDEFNLYGLSQVVPNYDYALDVILDNEPDEDLTEEQQEIIERNAEMLYGMIHARFIITAHGQQLMLDKYKQAEFGRCPRVLCNGHAVLPVGLSDLHLQNTVKLFCPRCQDVFVPKYSRHATLDGAYFGTTFPHLLLLQSPELLTQRPKYQYVPKIFGFKIHNTAATSQPISASSSSTAPAIPVSAPPAVPAGSSSAAPIAPSPTGVAGAPAQAAAAQPQREQNSGMLDEEDPGRSGRHNRPFRTATGGTQPQSKR
jgi:casein kinase II subunit beta